MAFFKHTLTLSACVFGLFALLLRLQLTRIFLNIRAKTKALTFAHFFGLLAEAFLYRTTARKRNDAATRHTKFDG